MTVVVIGLGSMGRRRIRLMQTMPNAPEIVGVNRSPERREAVEKELGIRTFATLEEAVSAARPQAAK
jgi:predicted dehydrogenase